MSELDQALERLHLCGFEYADALPNYGPMAVEALASLGHAALISGLMDVYAPRLPALAAGRPLREDEWARARGDFERAADWLASYERQLERSPWAAVLVRAFAELDAAPVARRIAPHALVRVGHAVRNLSQRGENRIRRRELAFALAYLAATARGMPSDPPTPAGSGDRAWGAWAERVNRCPADAEALARPLSALCRSGADLYLAEPERRAVLALGVVAPAAFRFLVPQLPAPLAKRILIALLSSLERLLPAQVKTRAPDELDDPQVDRCAQSVNEIRYRAACSVHEHAIVMAEACLREDALAPGTSLRRAAADAALRLSPAGYREWR